MPHTGVTKETSPGPKAAQYGPLCSHESLVAGPTFSKQAIRKRRMTTVTPSHSQNDISAVCLVPSHTDVWPTRKQLSGVLCCSRVGTATVVSSKAQAQRLRQQSGSGTVPRTPAECKSNVDTPTNRGERSSGHSQEHELVAASLSLFEGTSQVHHLWGK